MDTEKNPHLTLEQIPANRQLIEELSSHGLILQEARDDALQLLYPHKNWGLWASRLLLVIGVSLILAGIVYFFAFNWSQIPALAKLGGIQLGILGCIIASYHYGLERLSGKILLLSASMLVGVFLAVFGQIYQTGADAYSLFMTWSILIAGFVLIAEFAALWAMWLVITNLFLYLCWDQTGQQDHDMDMMITSLLAIFNLTFLGLREYFVPQGITWLSERWTRVILVVPILVCLLIPTISFIVEPSRATTSATVGMLLSLAVHIVLYVLYRFELRDMWALSAIFLSGCIIVESIGFKLLTEMFRLADAMMFLLAGMMTLGIFTFAIVTLRRIASEKEAAHVQ